ncbi:MAG: nitroreductase family protein [Bacteroidota bacterium]|nr:nitroreductase family protein [Bacteroidota bacterium]
MELIELLKNRRSRRRFTDRKIEEEKKDLLIKSVLLSPASKSSNPWEFVVVDDPELLKQLATSKPHGAELVAGASLAFVVLGNPAKSDVWVEDCSIASVLLQLEAEDLGLGSCWVQVRARNHADGYPASEFIKKLLGVPENLEVLSIVAIGYSEEEKKPRVFEKLGYEKIHQNKY